MPSDAPAFGNRVRKGSQPPKNALFDLLNVIDAAHVPRAQPFVAKAYIAGDNFVEVSATMELRPRWKECGNSVQIDCPKLCRAYVVNATCQHS